MDPKAITAAGIKGQAEIDLAASAAKQASNPEEIKKAAQQFEAMLLQQMLTAMWQTVPKSEISGSKEEALYRDMFNQAIAEEIAEKQSIGITDVIAKDIKNIDAKAGK